MNGGNRVKCGSYQERRGLFIIDDAWPSAGRHRAHGQVERARALALTAPALHEVSALHAVSAVYAVSAIYAVSAVHAVSAVYGVGFPSFRSTEA